MSDRVKLDPKNFTSPTPTPSPTPAPSAWDMFKRVAGAGTGYTATRRIGKYLTDATKGK